MSTRLDHPGSRRRRARREGHRAGFSLIELMIVVTIIGTVCALALPSMSTASYDRRVARGALDVLRLARRARSEAMGFGRAYALTIGQGSLGGVYTGFRLWRGYTSSCYRTNWQDDVGARTKVITSTNSCPGGSACVDQVDLSSSRYQRAGEVTTVIPGTVAFPGLDMLWCYEPNGRMMGMTNATGFRADNFNGTGGNIIAIQGFNGSATATRLVLLPFGGNPRML